MKKGDLAKTILFTTIAAADELILLLTDSIVPEPFKLYCQKNKRREYYVKNKTFEFIDLGYLKFEYRNNKKVLRLTRKGKEKLRKYQIFNEKDKKQTWDKKWRIIMYDVWENNRNKRDAFRREIKNFGFKQLQKSVWICPYECEEFVSLLKADKKFGNNVRYIVTEKVDNDYSLRKMFELHKNSRS